MIDGVVNSREVDYLLINLMEECAEVIHAASKCLRFGIAHDELGYGHNGQKVAQELGQILAVYDFLSSRGNPHFPMTPQAEGYRKKQAAIQTWLDADGK